ncbi:hypothetical protein D3C86_1987500 [compost metagenome]
MPPALFSRKMFTVLQGLEGEEGAAGILRSSEYKGAVLQTDSAGFFSDADPRFDNYEAHKAWSIRGKS